MEVSQVLRSGLLQELAINAGAGCGTQLLSPRKLFSNIKGVTDFPIKLVTGRVSVANLPK